MPRIARAVVVGVPHHVTQRGNNRQDAFFVDSDRRVYLDLLKTHAERFSLAVYGYCLMTNHVHLIVRIIRDSHQLNERKQVTVPN